MNRWMALLISLAVVLGAPLAFAEAGGKQAGAKRAQVEQRMQKLRARVLRSDAGLDEKKAAEVEKVLNKHAPARKQLQKESQQQRQAIRQLLDKDSNDQAAYEKSIKALRSAQKKLHELREKEIDELSKLLTPKQQAKILVSIRKLQSKLDRQLRAAERD
jgi:Spy/CpxP family protein refolding chaperone